MRKPYEYTSMKSLNEPKRSFWGSLASKANALLDDEDPPQSPTTRIDTPSGPKVVFEMIHKAFYFIIVFLLKLRTCCRKLLGKQIILPYREA